MVAKALWTSRVFWQHDLDSVDNGGIWLQDLDLHLSHKRVNRMNGRSWSISDDAARIV